MSINKIYGRGGFVHENVFARLALFLLKWWFSKCKSPHVFQSTTKFEKIKIMWLKIKSFGRLKRTKCFSEYGTHDWLKFMKRSVNVRLQYNLQYYMQMRNLMIHIERERFFSSTFFSSKFRQTRKMLSFRAVSLREFMCMH